MDEQAAHRHFSVQCFNEVWRLLELERRSAEDSRMMRELAHASLYHWMARDDCESKNLSVGLWQISRVYATLGQGPEAMVYAQECIELSESSELPAFYRGYAFEAAARAAAVINKMDECATFRAKAEERLSQIGDKEERELLEADLRQLGGLAAE